MLSPRQITHMKRRKKDTLLKYVLDIISVTVCYALVSIVYLHLIEEIPFTNIKLAFYPVYLILFLFFYSIFGQYSSIWKYYSFRNLVQGTFATIISGILFIISMYFSSLYSADWHRYLVAAVLIIVLTYMSATMTRVFRRWWYIKKHEIDGVKKRRLAIVGAGSACMMLLDYIQSVPTSAYEPICVFDDDESKISQRIGGIRIIGNTESIPVVCKELDIDEIIVAMPSVESSRLREIISICVEADVIVNTVPLFSEVKEEKGENLWKQVRKVKPEDLLGRKVIELDKTQVVSYIKGKTVLVTGGGGSIGSELCRQVAKLSPKKLVIMDIYENSTYDIQQELIRQYGLKLNLKVEIATMCDEAEVEAVFRAHKPNIVFHAAAHKHVPLMETNPEEAVKNNIFGTYNVIMAADRHKVKKFIQVSTDKAVNPTNIMGATKRFCEMMVQGMKGKSDTTFAAVRFGNVLGSNGSVIPLFRRQIENGGPVTVTHPDMKRYFMTIPEAVQLVMLAGTEAKSGNVYVLDMGELVKIDEFARKMIRLAGLVPDKDIKVEYTGLRPGEKLYEELIIDDNRVGKTNLDKVFVEKLPEITMDVVNKNLVNMRKAIKTGEKYAVVSALKEAVDTYTPDGEMKAGIEGYLSGMKLEKQRKKKTTA